MRSIIILGLCATAVAVATPVAAHDRGASRILIGDVTHVYPPMPPGTYYPVAQGLFGRHAGRVAPVVVYVEQHRPRHAEWARQAPRPCDHPTGYRDFKTDHRDLCPLRAPANLKDEGDFVVRPHGSAASHGYPHRIDYGYGHAASVPPAPWMDFAVRSASGVRHERGMVAFGCHNCIYVDADAPTVVVHEVRPAPKPRPRRVRRAPPQPKPIEEIDPLED
jgi:hypothetical protein